MPYPKPCQFRYIPLRMTYKELDTMLDSAGNGPFCRPTPKSRKWLKPASYAILAFILVGLILMVVCP